MFESWSAAISAVLPRAEIATLIPKSAGPCAFLGTSLACWVHVEPEPVNIHAAPPMVLLSFGPPKIAVVPSPDRSMEAPRPEWPVSPVAVSGCAPDGAQVEPLRLYTQTEPSPALSFGPPKNASCRTLDSATAVPKLLVLLFTGATVGAIFTPGVVQVAPLREKTQ